MSNVKIGKLERKEDYELNKQAIKDNRDYRLEKLDQKKDSLGKHQQNVYDDSDARRLARADKRADMQRLRDKERGKIRADRKEQRITRIMNRNNMTREEASQEYDNRRQTLDSYNKGDRDANPSVVNLETIVANNRGGNGSGKVENTENNIVATSNKNKDNQTKKIVNKVIGSATNTDPSSWYNRVGTQQ